MDSMVSLWPLLKKSAHCSLAFLIYIDTLVQDRFSARVEERLSEVVW
jgi:hypothetical protein